MCHYWPRRVYLPAGLAFDPAGNIIVGSGDASHTFVSTTSGDGSYGVALKLPAGYSANGVTFTACEESLDSTWKQTGPNDGAKNFEQNATASGFHWNGTFTTGTNTGEVDASGLNFGNVKLGQGGGLTLGFWSNV